MTQSKLPEAFIHYVWRTKAFNHIQLKTTEGHAVQIFDYGNLNDNAGPDFLNARIKIDETVWVGNVELHINSGEWYLHKHHLDKAYDSVILHVVMYYNKELKNSYGETIPTIELSDRIPHALIDRYVLFEKRESFIPCEGLLQDLDSFEIEMYKHRLLVERLEYKTRKVERLFVASKHDWNQTLHSVVLSSLGLNINSEAFETLASCCPYKLLNKYRDDHLKIEALLLGQAGFLAAFHDDYTYQLKDCYEFLAHKHSIKCMSKTSWKFFKMRPAQFPTLRIGIYCSLFLKLSKLLADFEKYQLNELYSVLDAQASQFWDRHFVLDKTSRLNRVKRLSQQAKDLLLINAILPFMFFYSKRKKNKEMTERVLRLFLELDAEDNKVTRKWKSMGLKMDTGFDSQSLLHLYNNYCKHKSCLSCQIGHKLLKENTY